MPQRTDDRRTARTRNALMRAFTELLFSLEFDDISVAAIVERANVGRSTFYTHFKSRDDILQASLTAPSMPLARLVGEDPDMADLLSWLVHFREQPRLARAFASGSLRKLWVRCLACLIEPTLTRLTQAVPVRALLPIEMIAVEISELQIALIIQWLSSHKPPPAAAVAEALAALTQASTAALLGREPAHLLVHQRAQTLALRR